ncbi:MAG: hypothetical protein IJK02_11660 [Clostridia bacterium]|nr:hypothetical protein [Clostridia bacterium]MBR0510207.1 hypothetical protein [Clostridia bacterium]
MSIYETNYQILSSDTDCRRRLRLSSMFTLLQEAAIAHTTALGFGREKTLDRGLLWAVALQHAKIYRLPEYDEQITLRSAPGEIMHTFYPRSACLTDAAGKTLVSSSALWVLMDRETRTMVSPEKTGVVIPGSEPDWKIFWPRTPKLPQAPQSTAFTVPYSYVDLNGHMNNTRYFDLAEDMMPASLRACNVREVMTEYTGEAKEGDTLRLTAETRGNTFFLAGAGEKRLFRLSIAYA